MEAEDILIDLLSTLGYSVIRQGSLTEDDEYEDTFFTFWNNETPEQAFYDNQPHSEVSDFDVNIYSTDNTILYGKLREAKTMLRANGFTIIDSGHDVMSDEVSHTGRGINVLYKNELTN